MPHLPDERVLPALFPDGLEPARASTLRSPSEHPPPRRFLCTTSLPTPEARWPPEIPPADCPAPVAVTRCRRFAGEALPDSTGHCPGPACLLPARATVYDFAA